MLIHQARTICHAESPDNEINQLKRTFRQNGYSNNTVKYALVPRYRSQTKQKPAGIAMI
jgi:hypothetical protein